MGLMEKIFGDLNTKEVKKLEKIAAQVEAYEDEYLGMGEEELRGKTAAFRKRLEEGETLDDLLPEAFAACREAAWRVLGMRHFHVQILGGIALHQGRIAEMKTGEGKTLVATLPVYLNALAGKGVHVVTVNDYLAKRDAEWMGRVYEYMGLTVGYVIHGVEGDDRRKAYLADVTYGTNNEFGFDYLRDNMVTYREQLVQRDLNYAIIDEVDSILIDEARTPLIISGKGDKSTDLYQKADDFVSGLTGIRVKDKSEAKGGKSRLDALLDNQEEAYEEEQDFVVEEKERQVSLTERGTKKAEAFFGVENFGDPDNMEINHHVNQALKAHNIMERDVDYIVKDDEIIIVDEFTGRLMFGRRFSNGLHQAIEAKEHVNVRSESKTLATITLQNYFRMYQKLAGMTGTAKTEEEEFRDIYNMDVVVVPTNMPVIREDLPDSIYTTENGKFKAIVNKIAEIHETGQPVLVGTISIEKSEKLSSLLNKRGIKHNVLNAKQHEREAEIVAEAGREGHVTIATNMAGRGTDILLGGNPEFETRQEMRKLEYSDEAINFALNKYLETEDPELQEARNKYNEIFREKDERFRKEHQDVLDRGGLFIIGSERHESRRIDNQLRGRSGRQGDVGSTQFYISLEDELMRLFGGDRMDRMQDLVGKMGMGEDDALEANMLSKTIENAQKRVEGRNFGIRKYVLQYDNVMNKQREIIYGERRKVLFGEDLREYVMHMRDTIVDTLIESATADSKYAEEWNLEGLNSSVRQLVPAYKGRTEYSEEELRKLSAGELRDGILKELDGIYEEKEKEIGTDIIRELERGVLLRVVDSLWMDHIDAMDQLKSGIGLRSIGQQDPAAEYAKEGFDMFEQLIGAIQEDTVRYCYGITLTTEASRGEANRGTERKDEFVDGGDMEGVSGMPGKGVQVPPRERKQETVRRTQPKVGRNAPCPCGSGKKYKNCHGKFENRTPDVELEPEE